jgi:hypothetical protein
MKRDWIAGAALLCLPALALAADWVKVPAPDGNKHWYDATKIVVEGEVITYWRLVEFRTAQATKAGFAMSAMYRETIDCRGHTHRTLGYLLYARDKLVIENVHTPDSEPEPVIPETLGDRYERVMCKLAPQIAAEQRNATATSVPLPPTKEEIRHEIEFLEARLRLLREQLDLQSKGAVVPGPEPLPPPTELR